ncbi:MAG: DUF4157 domain-containing protein [Thermoguttaceae bacterium]|nr:DUF4157 domain-containing protein [Thermoguttaceae bacterium]MDW8077976.1 DUF4157 domain-containing protein [Thermoguttaceae bacterium]
MSVLTEPYAPCDHESRCGWEGHNSRLTMLFCILWTLPNTIFGLALGVIGLVTGGSAKRFGRVLEFWGGIWQTLLSRFPLPGGIEAITFGHVVLYRSAQSRQKLRAHELVHVAQYERWGPLFIPAYLLASSVALLRGKNPYADNAFEAEAFRQAPSPWQTQG